MTEDAKKGSLLAQMASNDRVSLSLKEYEEVQRKSE